MNEQFERPQKKPSRLWYLLPIFLNIIGGVIGYFLLKDRDRKFAERLLIIGLVMIAVAWVANFLLAGLAYMYISGIFTSRTASIIEVFDATCSAGSHSIIVRNVGTESINTSDVMVSIDGNSVTCSWSGSLAPGSSATCMTTVFATSGSHTLRIVGPTNTVSGAVYCP